MPPVNQAAPALDTTEVYVPACTCAWGGWVGGWVWVCLSACLGEGGGDLVNQAAPALDVTSARSAATTSRSRAPPGFSVQRV